VTAEPLLSVVDLEAGYGGSRVLFGVSLAVGRSEVVTLLGRNGMGKTTTILSIMGILRCSAGSVDFAGASLTGLPSFRIARLGIGLVPEGRQVFPNLSVQENLVATAVPGGAGMTWDLERVLTLFPPLRDRLHSAGNLLSGGEQQMLAIGRALMTRAPMILVDEPSLGLAPKIIDQIYKILLDLREREKLTLLINEQSSHRILKHADRIYVLRAGQIRLQGTAEHLADGHAIKEAYFGFHEQQAAAG
jgi:branched-chain amino acid transport system ATP-binding protein